MITNRDDCKTLTAFRPLMAGLLLLFMVTIDFGADTTTAPEKDVVVQMMSALKASDADAARRCFVMATSDVTDATNAFIAERMALRALIASLEKRFPEQSGDLQQSKLGSFTDAGLDKESDDWRAATEKPLRDGSIVLKRATGYTLAVRKTGDGWRIDFASLTHGRVSSDNAMSDRTFVAEERERTELCEKIAAKARLGEYKSLREATYAYGAQLDAIEFAQMPAHIEPSTQPTTKPDTAMAWSLAGAWVAVCATDGSVKAWNFETGAVAAQFTERLKRPQTQCEISCGPGATVVGLVDPAESKSLRVLNASGQELAAFSDFQGTDQLPNGLIQRIIGITPDGSGMITSQNNDDYIGWFDLRAKRVTVVTLPPKQLADAQFSSVVALRDASGFVHFHGSEVTGYDFQGNIHWHKILPNVMSPMDNLPNVRWRPSGKLVFHRPHLEEAAVVTDATAFWVGKDQRPTRLDLRTGAMVPMHFDGSMAEVTALDADDGFIVTRDPDDDRYWLWDAHGRKCAIGDISGNQCFAFSPDGARLLTQAVPATFTVDHFHNLMLTDAIHIFRIGNGKCAEVATLR